jgi:hypothetical protein
MAQKKDSLWWGSVTTEHTARRIINMTGWGFLILGLCFTFRAATGADAPGGIPASYNALGTAVFVAAPAAFLISRRTRAPAVVMMISSGITALGLFLVIVRVGYEAPRHVLVVARLTLVVWLFMIGLSWRALTAASALRRLGLAAREDTAEITAFD